MEVIVHLVVVVLDVSKICGSQVSLDGTFDNMWYLETRVFRTASVIRLRYCGQKAPQVTRTTCLLFFKNFREFPRCSFILG